MFNPTRLKNARLYRHLTQKALGDLIGISASAVGMYEQNRRLPDEDTISRLSKALKVSEDWLCENSYQEYYEMINHFYQKILLTQKGIIC